MIDRPNWGSGGGLPAVVERTTAGSPAAGEVARPDWSGASTAARPSAATDDNTVVAELDAEEAATERAMLAHGLTHEEVARIRGKTVEEVGKPPITRQTINAEIAAIEKVMRKDRREYDRSYATRYRELIEMRDRLGNPKPAAAAEGAKAGDDEGGLPQSLLDEWSEQGGVEHHLAVTYRATQGMLEALDEPEAANLQRSFDALPEGAQLQAYRFLSVDGGAFPRASDDELAEFAETDGAPELIEAWGRDAAKKLGVVRGRVALMVSGMTPQDREAFGEFLDRLSASQAVAVFRTLAG